MSSFWLEYTQDGQRREFSFDKSAVSIGRDKGSDFVLDHPTVSRQHAQIIFGAGGPQLVVLSRGGLTAIDGSQVHGQVELFDGSEIHFGQLTFTFRSNQAPRRPQGNGTNGWANGGQPLPNAPLASGSWNPASESTDWSPGSQEWAGPSQTTGQSAPATDDAWNPGGWDAPASGGGAAAESEPDLVSWDDIANQADPEENFATQGVTDFEKMQQARAKLESQSKGPNKVLIAALVLVVGGMGYAFLKPKKKSKGGPAITDVKTFDETPVITYMAGDIDCVGKAACEQAAVASYSVGKSTWEQRDADITNLYMSYAHFDKSTKLLEAGDVAPIPADLADVQSRKDEIKRLMDEKFQGYRVKFHNQKKLKRYREMVETLDHISAYFPDPRSKYHKWAQEQALEMKSEGIYPKAPRF